MHVAVAGVHVGRDEQAARTDLPVDRVQAPAHAVELPPLEHLLQGALHLLAIGDPEVPALQEVEEPVALAHAPAHRRLQQVGERGRGHVQVVEEGAPARADPGQGLAGRAALRREDRVGLGAGLEVGRLAQLGHVARQVGVDGVHHAQLVAHGLLDVDALEAVAVIAEALQRDDHVLVDLEGVCVRGDGRDAGALVPEAVARLGAHRDEPLGGAGVGELHHLGGGPRHGVLVVTSHVEQQDHLRPVGPRGLRGVAHRAHVALVHVLHACAEHARLLVEEPLGLDDRRHRVLDRAEELEADRAQVPGLRVQDEHCRGDEPVAAFLLHPGQPPEELVGDVLAEARAADLGRGDPQHRGLALGHTPVGPVAGDPELTVLQVVDLPEVVVQALDLEPGPVGHHHAPGDQVVEGAAPGHGLLAPGVQRDVPADGRGVLGGRVHREDVTRGVRRLGHPLGDRAGPDPHDRHGPIDARDGPQLRAAHRVQLLGVHDGRLGVQRHRAARVARAAAARDDGQPALDAGRDHSRDLLFGIWGHDHERQLHAPVGGIRDVGHARVAVELDVVLAGHPGQAAQGLPAQLLLPAEPGLEPGHGLAGARRELERERVAGGPGHDLVEPVVQGVHERGPALRALQHVVLDEGVALDDPHVPQDLEEHPRRPPGAALAAELVQHLPHGLAEDPDDDLPVRERRVVVRDLANARSLDGFVHLD